METSEIIERLKTAQTQDTAAREALEEVTEALKKTYREAGATPDDPIPPVRIIYDPINQAMLLNGRMVTTNETAALAKYFKFLEETGLTAQLPDVKETTDEKI